MPMRNLAISTGATLSATGGTAVTFATDGLTIDNGLHLVDAGSTNFLTQAQITAKYKRPTLMSDGSFSKDRKSLTLVEPFTDSKGKIHFNLLEIRREVHPETSAASALDLLKKGGQLTFDSDTTSFWSAGSMD